MKKINKKKYYLIRITNSKMDNIDKLGSIYLF